MVLWLPAWAYSSPYAAIICLMLNMAVMGCSRGCYVVLCAMTRESPDPAARRCRSTPNSSRQRLRTGIFAILDHLFPKYFLFCPQVTKFNHQTSVLGSPNGHDALKRTFSQRRVTTSRSADSSLDPSPPRETQGRFAGRLTRRWPTPLGSQSTASRTTQTAQLKPGTSSLGRFLLSLLEVGDAQVK